MLINLNKRLNPFMKVPCTAGGGMLLTGVKEVITKVPPLSGKAVKEIPKMQREINKVLKGDILSGSEPIDYLVKDSLGNKRGIIIKEIQTKAKKINISSKIEKEILRWNKKKNIKTSLIVKRENKYYYSSMISKNIDDMIEIKDLKLLKDLIKK